MGFLVLIVLVVGGLGFAVVRLRRRPGPQAGHEEWTAPRERREPAPAEPRPQTSPFDGMSGSTAEHPAAERPVATAAPAPRMARPVAALGGAPGGWAVETHGLTKRFGSNVAVDDVELLVPRGYAFGYLGPNGAGKTTLIRTLLGLTRANAGTMSLLGIPVPAERRTAIAEAGLTVTLPAGAPREAVAEINRRLVGSGISVYGLQEVRTSLEDWFLSVTSRLGERS